jgi:hypothetical protein
MNRLLATLLACLVVLAVAPAAAHDDDKKDGPPGATAKEKETGTGNLFGFSEDTDTPDKGEKEVSLDTFSRFYKRRLFGPQLVVPDDAGTAVAPLGKPRWDLLSIKAAYQYGITDDFSVEVGLFGHARDVRNLGDVPNKRYAAFDGGSVEFKYRLLERTEQNPFAFALVFEPRYAHVEEGDGRGVDAFQAEALAVLDARVIPNRLWFATNIGYEPELSRARGTGQTERASGFTWSNALTARVADNAFAGAEVRYVAAFDGAFFNRFAADAFYIGPTANIRFTEQTYLTAALSFRITGSEPTPAPGEITAAQFPRTLLRLKVGASF